MKILSLSTLLLLSHSALATDARVGAFQGNQGFTDDTDYRRYYSLTDNGRDSMWFDVSGPEEEDEGRRRRIRPAPETLSAAYKADGRSVRLQQNTVGTTDIHYFAADGNSGYSVMLRAINKDDVTIGGGYGITNGDTDRVLGGDFTAGIDSTNATVFIRSRTLTKTQVTAWSTSIGYVGTSIGQEIVGNIRSRTTYDLGWRFKTDRSTAAVTLGPRVILFKAEDEDADIDLSPAAFNIAGEFALTDWLGLRGSVATSLNAELPVGDQEFDMKTTPVRPAFGVSLDFEGCDVDFMVDPVGLMNGDDIWTGESNSQHGAMMSARFDI